MHEQEACVKVIAPLVGLINSGVSEHPKQIQQEQWQVKATLCSRYSNEAAKEAEALKTRLTNG